MQGFELPEPEKCTRTTLLLLRQRAQSQHALLTKERTRQYKRWRSTGKTQSLDGDIKYLDALIKDIDERIPNLPTAPSAFTKKPLPDFE